MQNVQSAWKTVHPSYFKPFLTEWQQNNFAPSEKQKSLTTRFLSGKYSLFRIENVTDTFCYYCSSYQRLLPPGGGTVFSATYRHKILYYVYRRCFTYPRCGGSPGASTYAARLFFSTGFPDYVPPPRGSDLPHHVLIREQHGPSGNLGHVSPRCGRRADRGERWMIWACGVGRCSSDLHLSPQSSAQRWVYMCGVMETLFQRLLYCQMSHEQLVTSSCALFFLPSLPRWPITPNVRYCATSCLQCLQLSS